ncbi:MAG TPA: hypothetical protein VGS19_10535 [Streptosporangiaceae bacterium]|nr:hypothetical protein [Streptosporangiaceae bacterium]
MGQPPGDSAAAHDMGAAPAAVGDERVDEALSRLADLEELPVTEHPEVFTYVHQRLSEALGDLSAPPGGGQGRPGDGPRGPRAPGR